MKNIYDVYNKLQQNSVTGTEFFSDTNTLEYNTAEYSVKACEAGDVFQVVIYYDGYEYAFIAPDCQNLFNLLFGLHNGEITINSFSDIYIKLIGYSNKKIKRYSKVKAVILSIIGILTALFAIMMCLALPIGSLLFDETFDFFYLAEVPLFLSIFLFSISLVRYAILQNKYNRRIWMDFIGYPLVGFFSCTSIIMFINDYDKENGYSVDTFGTFSVMLIFILCGVAILIFSKRKQAEQKFMLLIRTPVLPCTTDADAIFRYMEEACSEGKLPFDVICSTGRIEVLELDLFMRYSADKLSIPIDKTLMFDELFTVISQDIVNNFDNSNVAKYYYYDEYH